MSELACVICLDDLKNETVATIAACKHEFCLSCLEKWINIKEVCPLDRSEIDSIIVMENEEMKTISIKNILEKWIISQILIDRDTIKDFIKYFVQTLEVDSILDNQLKLLKKTRSLLKVTSTTESLKLIFTELLNHLNNRVIPDTENIKSAFKVLVKNNRIMMKKAVKYNIKYRNGRSYCVQRLICEHLMFFMDNLESMTEGLYEIFEFGQKEISSIDENSRLLKFSPVICKMFKRIYKKLIARIGLKDQLSKAIKCLILTEPESISSLSIMFHRMKWGNCVICNKKPSKVSIFKFKNCDHFVCTKCVMENIISGGFCPLENNPSDHCLSISDDKYPDTCAFWKKNKNIILERFRHKFVEIVSHIIASGKAICKFVDVMYYHICNLQKDLTEKKHFEIVSKRVLSIQMLIKESIYLIAGEYFQYYEQENEIQILLTVNNQYLIINPSHSNSNLQQIFSESLDTLKTMNALKSDIILVANQLSVTSKEICENFPWVENADEPSDCFEAMFSQIYYFKELRQNLNNLLRSCQQLFFTL